ncbi:MAG: type II toxin-antitoxin system RelE/ParE family toxin [Opitutaceae bacterium]|nr:type II toxin-antitoxin system RelE/ParE family toxin [Opitutaceae bacterium]
MKLEFHPAVQHDFNAAVDYYETAGGPNLADRFEAEFRACLESIRVNHRSFAFYQGSQVFRRIRLQGFPFVIIYRETSAGIRVTLLKHERRHPLFGLHRH